MFDLSTTARQSVHEPWSIERLVHYIKPSSVDSYLSGICYELEPIFPSIHAICKHHFVTHSLASCKRMLNTPTYRKLPLEADYIIALLRSLGLGFILPSVPGLDLSTIPGLNLPGITLPGLNLPGLNLPGLNLPGLNLPGLKV